MYANHEDIITKGLDPSPKHNDVVQWVGGEKWTVNTEDDLQGPSALCHWPDGGWCNVILLRRGQIIVG